ncbi:MAG: ABC transporter permease [Gammaproteobacteria bacterium]|nr:ABC transporter permease [Gammaproteobacteria bacterium]
MSETPMIEVRPATDGCAVVLSGPWNLKAFRRNLESLRRELAALVRKQTCHWDLRQISALDSIGAFLLWQNWNRRLPADVMMRDEHRTLFQQWTDQRPLPPAPGTPRFEWLVTAVGGRLLAAVDHLQEALAMFGQLVLDTLYLLRRPRRTPWREISATIYQAGARALLITALVGSLIGLVVSYLSSIELRAYGAQTYVVNIVGLGVIRELGPMLTAILVAGRSGSSMTAQLGVMRVTQELDALAAMGISHTLRLVLPKVIALLIAMPLLVVWTDCAALLGGMTAAKAQLGISFQHFLNALPGAVPLVNLWIGFGKGAVFGALVALTAAHFGLRIEPNTQSLGVETTNSVVTSITLVIVVDAVFAVLLQNVGLR